MKRPLGLVAISAVLALAGCIALVMQADVVMPSYLAFWLFWMALPLGALPIVMAADLVGAGGVLVLILRRMLLLIFPGALLGTPLMLWSPVLYGRPDGLPAAWMAPQAFVTRMVIMLAIWWVLAALFSGPSRSGRRTGLALIGLMLHLCMGSVAAIDWVMSLQPSLGSSAFGLLLITSQMAIAGTAALLVLSVESTSFVPIRARVVLACVLGGWVFVHMTQYLVVWSANLPREIVWYQLRTLGLGTPVIWMAAVCTLAALLALPTTFARSPIHSAFCAGMLLTVQVLAMLWLVIPVFRGGFLLTLADGFALLGLGGIAIALLVLARPRQLAWEISHEAA
jgi:hypothetical protein